MVAKLWTITTTSCLLKMLLSSRLQIVQSYTNARVVRRAVPSFDGCFADSEFDDDFTTDSKGVIRSACGECAETTYIINN
jgi:hypothetical protein